MTDELPLPGGVTTEAIADAVDEILRTSNWDEVTIKLVLAKLEKILLPAGSAGMLKPHKKAIKLEVDTAMQRIIDERALASAGLDTDALVQPPAEEALTAAPRGDSAKRAREEEAGKGEAGGEEAGEEAGDEAADEAGVEAAHGNKKARAGEEGAADDAEEDETAESGGDVPLDTADGAGEQVKAAVDDDLSDVFASEDEPEDEARSLTTQSPHMAPPPPPPPMNHRMYCSRAFVEPFLLLLFWTIKFHEQFSPKPVGRATKSEEGKTFYGKMAKNGEEFRLGDDVYLENGSKEPYVARLQHIFVYDFAPLEVYFSARWYYREADVHEYALLEGGGKDGAKVQYKGAEVRAAEHELFFSLHMDENHADCILRSGRSSISFVFLWVGCRRDTVSVGAGYLKHSFFSFLWVGCWRDT